MLYIDPKDILEIMTPEDRQQLVRDCEEFFKDDFRKAMVDIVKELELDKYYLKWYERLPYEDHKILKSIHKLKLQLAKTEKEIA